MRFGVIVIVGHRVNDDVLFALMRGRGLWRVSKQVWD